MQKSFLNDLVDDQRQRQKSAKEKKRRTFREEIEFVLQKSSKSLKKSVGDLKDLKTIEPTAERLPEDYNYYFALLCSGFYFQRFQTKIMDAKQVHSARAFLYSLFVGPIGFYLTVDILNTRG